MAIALPDPMSTRLCLQRALELFPELNVVVRATNEMNDLLIQDAIVLPLVARAKVSGSSNRLVGVDITPWDADTWNIQDWRRNHK